MSWKTWAWLPELVLFRSASSIITLFLLSYSGSNWPFSVFLLSIENLPKPLRRLKFVKKKKTRSFRGYWEVKWKLTKIIIINLRSVCACVFLSVVWPGEGTIMRFLVGKASSLQLRMCLRKLLIATSMTSRLYSLWQLILTITHLFRVTVTSSFCGLMDKILFLFFFVLLWWFHKILPLLFWQSLKKYGHGVIEKKQSKNNNSCRSSCSWWP